MPNVAYLMDWQNEQDESEAYFRTPQGELELAMYDLENAAQRVLKVSDFTPEIFSKPYIGGDNKEASFQEAFVEVWRMVNWIKENLSGDKQ